MKRTDLAYVAGIIDGEGHIGIFNLKRNTYQVRVQVGNTNEWLIQWLKFSFGGSIYSTKKQDNHRPFWQWTLHTKQASTFLALILPYLKIKKPQAEIAIQLQCQKKRLYGKPKAEEAIAVEEAQKILIQSMNRPKVN